MKNQQGVTVYGLIAIAIVLGFFILVGFRLLPVYIENLSVKSVLKSIAEEPTGTEQGITDRSVPAIRDMLQKRLRINNITQITADDVEITQVKEGVMLHVIYDIRVPIMGNVDAMVHFDDSVVVPEQ